MMMATFGADPLAYAEVLDSRVLEATISACLRGGVEPVHCKENASPPQGFVFELSPEFAPRGIRDVTRQLVILHHPANVEILNEDDPVLFCDKIR